MTKPRPFVADRLCRNKAEFRHLNESCCRKRHFNRVIEYKHVVPCGGAEFYFYILEFIEGYPFVS